MYIFTKETEKMNYLLNVFEVYFLESFNYRLSKMDITYWCILFYTLAGSYLSEAKRQSLILFICHYEFPFQT